MSNPCHHFLIMWSAVIINVLISYLMIFYGNFNNYVSHKSVLIIFLLIVGHIFSWLHWLILANIWGRNSINSTNSSRILKKGDYLSIHSMRSALPYTQNMKTAIKRYASITHELRCKIKNLNKILANQIQQYMKRELPHDQVLSQESKVGLIFKYQVINKQKRKLWLSQEMQEKNW